MYKTPRIFTIVKNSNGWTLPNQKENIWLGLDYLSVCVKGSTDIRDIPTSLLPMWSVDVKSIEDHFDLCLSKIMDPEIKPAVVAEVRKTLEGNTGDLTPVMFRSIPRANVLETSFCNVAVAPDKATKWAADYAREKPTNADGSTFNFNDYLQVRGNQEIDQFNNTVKALFIRSDVPSIIIETPLNRHVAKLFYGYEHENVEKITAIMDGLSSKPFIYKRFDFKTMGGSMLDLTVYLRDLNLDLNLNSDLGSDSEVDTFVQAVGFSVGLLELLSKASMLIPGHVNFVFSTTSDEANTVNLLLNAKDNKLNISVIETNESIYNLNSREYFILKDN